MAEYLVQDASIETIADAIRSKAGVSGKLAFPDGFASAITGIEMGSQVATGTISSANGVTSITIAPGFVVKQIVVASYKAQYTSNMPAAVAYYFNGSGKVYGSGSSSNEVKSGTLTLSSNESSTTLTFGSSVKIYSGGMVWLAVS